MTYEVCIHRHATGRVLSMPTGPRRLRSIDLVAARLGLL